MKSELADMQTTAQSDNQALAQQLSNIAQEKCDEQISQLRCASPPLTAVFRPFPDRF